MVVLRRIFHALAQRYHGDHEPRPNHVKNARMTPVSAGAGSHALLDVSVQTCLSLVFSLLQQNWHVSGLLGVPPLCNSVLETFGALIRNLPPLSLSSDVQLTPLGLTSLDQVSGPPSC